MTIADLVRTLVQEALRQRLVADASVAQRLRKAAVAKRRADELVPAGVRRKIAGLHAKTVANGCTSGEAASAAALADSLLSKYRVA